MKFIQDLVSTQHVPQTTAIDILMDTLGGSNPCRGHDHIHASNVTKTEFCPREVALLDITKKKPMEYIPPALQATFDVGNATSDLVRESWVGQFGIGNWRCDKCGVQRTFCKKPVSLCPTNPNTKCVWRYVECNYTSLTYGISGSIDLILDLGAQKKVAYELKIMAPDAFEKLSAPLAEHRLRTALYLYLIEDSNSAYSGSINLQQAGVLYVSRGHGKKNAKHNAIIPFKEYMVNRDDAGIQPYLNHGKTLRLWRENHIMPKGICETSLCKRFKACPVNIECFSGKYPHQ